MFDDFSFSLGASKNLQWKKKEISIIPTTIRPHPYQTPVRINTEARAGAALTRPTTRPAQIGKCAPVRPPPATRGAFVDLGIPGSKAGGRSSGHGLCMVCGGFVVALWSVCVPALWPRNQEYC